MTEEERNTFKEELRRNGFRDAEYTPYNGQGRYGQFNLWRGHGRGLYIREARPAIGFSGTEYNAMRQWADDKIRAFVNDDTFQGWVYDSQTSNPGSSNANAVWFNLIRETGQEGNWYESSEIRQNVITVAKTLYQKLKDEGIFGEHFDPSKYSGDKAGNQTEEHMKNESLVESTVKSLLEANLNVILPGAPGTGKTYTAKEVAKAMVGAKVSKNATDDEKKRAKSVEKERIESVQFHPGYDYADFVVGMKPVLICGGKKVFRDAKGSYTKIDEKKEEYDEKNIGERLSLGSKTEVSFLWEDGVFKKFADKAKADLEHNYVFLIDEINRSDLSRVFGELFSLLEEEYRYPNDKGTGITLPDGEEFVIPKNLYIIGTMNDIDRSVESMDFALRRRFAWYEVKPEDPDSQNMDAIIQAKVDEKKIKSEDAWKLDEAMKALNKLIAPRQKKEGDGDAQKAGDKQKVDLRLGSEYQLGGAIFAKFEKYAGGKDPFGELWRNHIENILKEYLRGRSNRDDLLKELKKVYETSVGIATGTKEPA